MVSDIFHNVGVMIDPKSKKKTVVVLQAQILGVGQFRVENVQF